MAQHSWSQRHGAGRPRRAVRAARDGGPTTRSAARSPSGSPPRPDTTVNVHSRTNEWHGTYADIDDEARRLIALLRAEGLEPGDVVAFQLPNWREAIVVVRALAMGGYVLVPIVHIYGRKEVAFILDRVRRRRLHRAGRVRPRRLHRDHRRGRARRAPRSTSSSATAPTGPRPTASAASVGTSSRRCEPVRDLPTPTADDVAVLAYTSGTTSDPKGVIHDHRTMLSELRHMDGWVTPGEPNLMGSPVTHATGMLGAVLGPLDRGGDIHLIDRWDPGHALEVMLAYDIGGGTGASIFLATLLDHPDFTPEHAANMERIGLGGAPVPVELGRRAERARHQDHPRLRLDRAPVDHRQPVRRPGRPAPRDRWAARCRAWRSASSTPTAPTSPAGDAGEILSRGPELCLGYTEPGAQRRLRRRRLVPHRRHRRRSTSTAA